VRVYQLRHDVRLEVEAVAAVAAVRAADDLREAVVVVDGRVPDICKHVAPARGHITAG
jgi:hypothetical protein